MISTPKMIERIFYSPVLCVQDDQPAVSLQLPHAILREVTLSGPLPSGVDRHSVGFAVTAQPSPRGESPRAVVRGSSSVDLQRQEEQTASPPAIDISEIILAADDSDQHAAWLRKLLIIHSFIPWHITHKKITPFYSLFANSFFLFHCFLLFLTIHSFNHSRRYFSAMLFPCLIRLISW